MELGQRIKEARLVAGLSQRQLCGDTITRNMLSRIENGTVRPSMTTLQFLAEQLGKPVSYFLDESTVTSPNLQVMSHARQCYRREDYAGTLAALEKYESPDETFEDEKLLLQIQRVISETEVDVVGGGKRTIPCHMINCFCGYSDYVPLTLDEWIENDKLRKMKQVEK